MGDWAPERTDIVTYDGEVALDYLWRIDLERGAGNRRDGVLGIASGGTCLCSVDEIPYPRQRARGLPTLSATTGSLLTAMLLVPRAWRGAR